MLSLSMKKGNELSQAEIEYTLKEFVQRRIIDLQTRCSTVTAREARERAEADWKKLSHCEIAQLHYEYKHKAALVEQLPGRLTTKQKFYSSSQSQSGEDDQQPESQLEQLKRVGRVKKKGTKHSQKELNFKAKFKRFHELKLRRQHPNWSRDKLIELSEMLWKLRNLNLRKEKLKCSPGRRAVDIYFEQLGLDLKEGYLNWSQLDQQRKEEYYRKSRLEKKPSGGQLQKPIEWVGEGRLRCSRPARNVLDILEQPAAQREWQNPLCSILLRHPE